jgi:hypothetical protein
VTKRQLQRGIGRYLAGVFPELSVAGDLLVARNGSLLHGFAFERSQMDKSTFRLYAFAQLLSVPAETVTLDLSEELGSFRVDGDEESSFKAAAQQADGPGREFLSKVRDCESLLSNLDSIASELVDDRLVREIHAHCLIGLDRDEDALQELEALQRDLSPPELAYEEAGLARSESLTEALTSSHAEAAALLDNWTREIATALAVTDPGGG